MLIRRDEIMARAAEDKPANDEISSDPNQDFLWLHIREIPYFRALLRAVEARFYQDYELTSPILDLGCGDGHFASLAFQGPLDVGIDPWSGPIREASQRGRYNGLAQAEGGRMPFPNDYFNAAISNSVLEHIPHIDEVIYEVGRVLKPGALFLFCVPNHKFSASLSVGAWLDRLRLNRQGDAYRAFFNRIARHRHLDPPSIWHERLAAAGLEVERQWDYYSPAAMRVSEWGHYFGLPSLLCRMLTGRWILAPTRWNLGLTYRLLKPYYIKSSEDEQGVCTFYVSRKISAE